jgi:peptidoglycan/xylan/chitin deacetylase (PgdA/CDA1 family)
MDETKRDSCIKELSGKANILVNKHKKVFMGWKELSRINKVFTVGSHTMHHVILTNESQDVVKEEINTSRKLIKEKLGECQYFTYPNGRYNEFSINILKKVGFKLAFTTQPDYCEKRNNFKLGRFYVAGDESINVFKAKLVGLDYILCRCERIWK